MKSANAIIFDFQRASKKAEELEEIASDMRKMAEGELQESLQNLSAAWKGESANEYLKKGFKLQEKILKSAKDLERTALAIRKVAKKTYDAEMLAYRIAMDRLYKKN